MPSGGPRKSRAPCCTGDTPARQHTTTHAACLKELGSGSGELGSGSGELGSGSGELGSGSGDDGSGSGELGSGSGGDGSGSPSPPASPPGTFTSKAPLEAAVQAFNDDSLATTKEYGPIADWDVSAVTDMSYLFYGSEEFNSDISSWNTSGVMDMSGMFGVRSARALWSPAFCQALSMRTACATAASRPPASRPAPRPQHCMPFLRLGRRHRRLTSR